MKPKYEIPLINYYQTYQIWTLPNLIVWIRNLTKQTTACDNDHELYMINEDIYPAMQECTIPCTEVTFHPTVVEYQSRKNEMEHTCEQNYVLQIVFNQNARVSKVDILFTKYWHERWRCSWSLLDGQLAVLLLDQYFCHYCLFFFIFFSSLRPFLMEWVLRSKTLFDESCSEHPLLYG